VERLERIVQRLVKAGVLQENELRPCSQADIRRLETRHGVRLPEAYKLFLRRVGRGAGDFLTDDHWDAFYDDLLDLDSDFRKESDVRAKISGDWFCFATRMGDVYLFLANDGSDDPPVYGWGDSEKLEKLYESFWDWLEEMADDAVRHSGSTRA
jgi:hypothetical protein